MFESPGSAFTVYEGSKVPPTNEFEMLLNGEFHNYWQQLATLCHTTSSEWSPSKSKPREKFDGPFHFTFDRVRWGCKGRNKGAGIGKIDPGEWECPICW